IHTHYTKDINLLSNDTATTKIYTLSLHDALPILKEQAKLDKTDNKEVKVAKCTATTNTQHNDKSEMFNKKADIVKDKANKATEHGHSKQAEHLNKKADMFKQKAKKSTQTAHASQQSRQKAYAHENKAEMLHQKSDYLNKKAEKAQDHGNQHKAKSLNKK